MKKTLFVIGALIAMISALTVTVRAVGGDGSRLEVEKSERLFREETLNLSEQAEKSEIAETKAADGDKSNLPQALQAEPPDSLRYVDDYIISGSGEDLGLYKYEGDAPVLITEGSLSEVLSRIDGGRVSFNGVSSLSGAEIFCGEYTFTGSLELLGTLTVSEGACVDFKDFSLISYAPFAVRIKGGELNIENSEIISKVGVGVWLDYSSSSALTLGSGKIISECNSPAIKLDYGKAKLMGGRVECCVGAAVYNDSSLLLGGADVSGVSADIITERPITLSDELPKSHLTVEYTGDLPIGYMTEMFYSASPEAQGWITLKNCDGLEFKLTFFEEYEGTDERNFLSVYLPYTVKYYSDGVLCYTENRLYGEKISGFDIGERVGYNFLGWSDSCGTIKNDRIVYASIELYATYELLPPNISIDSYLAEYTGNIHTVGFSSITHPLDVDGGFCEFEWLLNGVTVSLGKELTLSRVSDSGEYSCIITYRHKTASISVTVENITVRIEPAVIKIPTLGKQYYDGTEKLSGLRDNGIYKITEPRPISSGEYTVYIELSDKESYIFENGERSASLPFEILPAENGWVRSPSIRDLFSGNEPSPSATPIWGTPVYRFYEIIDGKYVECKPKVAGKYYLICEVLASENYSGLKSDPIPFEILSEKLVGISLAQYPKKTDYVAFEKFSAVGLSVIAKFNSGREEEISAELLTVSYQAADSFRFGDTAVLVSYLGFKTSVPVSISLAEYDLGKLKLDDMTVVYNGERQTYEGALPEITGLDGLPLLFTVSGGGRDVGEYELVLSFSTDSLNYNVPEPMISTLEVIPKNVKLTWSETEFVYSDETLCPSAFYTDVFGVTRYPTVSGGAISAGGPYMARVQAEKNYVFENPETNFTVSKAQIDLSSVRWSDRSFVYNGEERRVELLGLPSELTLLGYTDNSATAAGKYTARAIVKYDENNYLPPQLPTLEWEITRATYDTSTFSIVSVKATYDGKLHYPEIVGRLPVGADGSVLTYSFSQGATHVSEGEVRVLVEFYTSSKNYLAPSPVYATVLIEPLGITVEWQNTELVYNGELQAPTAHSPHTSIKIIGGGKNAGRHTVIATSESADYKVISPECEFIIRKAENKWITAPEISNIYEGAELFPKGKPLAGEVKFLYYKTASLDEPSEKPTASGIYYMVAYAEESENYLSLRADPIRFEIIKVVAVGIRAELHRERIYAMETLTADDIIVTLIFNNGTEEIWHGEVDISYQHANSLRASDTELCVNASGFSSVIGIKVNKAIYDTSGTVWTNTLTVYSGKPQCPELLGLPEGVEIVSLGKEPFINAGQYELAPIISFDEENFEPPILPPCVFTIRRQTLSAPIIPSLTYNGARQDIPYNSELFTLNSEPIINAGEYSVSAVLKDPDNYEFIGGNSSITVLLTVLPRELVYSVSNSELYLFEELGTVKRVHIGGEVLEGDELSISQKISGNKIILTSSNPNYTVTVIGGNIIRHGSLSPVASARLVLILLIILLLIIILLLLYFGRRKLYELILVAKHNIRERRMHRIEEATEYTLPNKERIEKYGEEGSADALEERLSVSEDGEAEVLDKSEKEAEGEKFEAPITDSEGVDIEKADSLITDSLAKDLIKRGKETVRTAGRAHSIINVDTLSESFSSGERVDVNILKSRGLVPYDTAYLKVLARGIIDKPLKVYANEFSLSAVKMIALTGGEAIRVVTLRERSEKGGSDIKE